MGSGARLLPQKQHEAEYEQQGPVVGSRMPPSLPTLGAWPPACHREQVSSAWAWNSSASSICFRRCSRDFSSLLCREARRVT